MASLFNTRISDTYSGLIKTIDNAALTASLKELTDGTGLASGVFMNTAGDFKVTAILEFGSLKDTGENITISKFVDAADGIGNNDNDTTIPTTAAIIDYVAAQITIEDLDFTGDTGSGQIDLDSQIFAIGGTTNEITTVASGQSITFSLDSTGVNLPDNSTAITQTAGDNSTKIATTSYVDTLDAASDLDFSGDSGTGDVNLNTQTFAITGTTNQIESSASNQGLSLQFPSAGVTLPNGSVATTQSAGDNSTKVATTSYVDTLDAASDLDITDGTNTGDVNLNTQSLSILGTTNEIDSVVSGQSVTLGLPNQINVNVQGNLTGNVTGDVTGDLTGDSAGTHTGAVLGNVTGNVTGDVTGDLTGNADTATAWETARDLSLTGQATGTISSVDGTNNVSGAVTLDNNSVTGKVLTGLTSPSASSVLATDTIVEGFGKLQSQVNGLAGGLRFIGSWDADTNSPVLSDGGGEAANGTTTSTSANKLVDSSASFTSTVTVGDQVVNQVDGQTALVSNVDSDTTLSLDADIMLSGEAYTIDNSPFITQGHYYVVSVGGTTTLNGVSNWTVGDWVIAGANNQWTKLDHSQVDGTGTTGNLTKWSSTSVIADSIVSESGSAITVDGSLSTNTNLSSTGNFAVNTDKFTVAAASGNTAFAGDLAINTNKFTVNATSGNVVVAGDVTLSSGYLNVTTDGSVAYGLLINSGDQSHSRIRINNTGSGGNAWSIMSGTSGVSNDGFAIRNETTTTTALQFTNSGNATFAGSVTTGASLISTNAIVDNITAKTTNGNLTFKTNAGSTIAQFANNLNATFAGSITFGDSHFIGDDGDDNLLIQSSANENIIIDSADDLILDAGGNDIRFKVAGVEFGKIKNDSGNFSIYSSIENEDILFKGNDGGSTITALTLDMSEGGNATFAGNVGIGGNANGFGSDTVLAVYNATTPRIKLQNSTTGTANTDGAELNMSSSDFIIENREAGNIKIFNNGGERMRIDSNGNFGFSVVPQNSSGTWRNFQIGGANLITRANDTNGLLLGTGFYFDTASAELYKNTAAVSRMYFNNDIITFQNAASGTAGTAITWNERMRIDSSGNVGIGGTAGDGYRLQVVGNSQDSATISMTYVGVGAGALKMTSNGAMAFGVDNADGSTERMRIDSSGNTSIVGRLGVGDAGTGVSSQQLKVRGDSNSSDVMVQIDNTKYGSTDTSGESKIVFGWNNHSAAAISAYKDGTVNRTGFKFFTEVGYNVPVEAMRITSSGQIRALQYTGLAYPFNGEFLGGADVATANLQAGSTSGFETGVKVYGGGNATPNIITMMTASAERMRIDSSGNVTIKAPSSSGGGVLNLENTTTATGSADYVGKINFIGNDSGTGASGVRSSINAHIQGYNGETDLVFSTAPASSAVTERMRITSGGDFKVIDGFTELTRASNGNQIALLTHTGTVPYGMQVRYTGASPNTTDNYFFIGSDSSANRIIIWGNGNIQNQNNSYGAISDKKLKENIVDATPKLDDLMKVKIRNYNLIGDDKKQIGVIAQEIENVFPNLVEDTKDPENEETTKSVKYSVLVPIMLKAIQELKAEVDLLKQECKCKN